MKTTIFDIEGAAFIESELSKPGFSWNHSGKRGGMFIALMFPNYPFGTCKDKRNCVA